MISKKSIIALLITMTSAFVGCGVNTTPVTMIKSPLSVVENQKDTSVDTANSFIPKDSKLTIAKNLEGGTGIELKDIDGDGKEELITFYKTNDAEPKVGMIILKQAGNTKWEKIYEAESEEATAVDYVNCVDITGDGKPEVLVGWFIGSNAKALDIVSLQNGKPEKIASDYYSKIEVEDMPDANGKTDNKNEVALWVHDTGETYNVDVYRWDGSKLDATTDTANYYANKVVPYYEEKVKTMPNAAFYWYYLAKYQILANNPKASLSSIEKGVELKKQNPKAYPDIAAFDELKENASEMLLGK
jgi:bla regulator protein BlaR1